MSDDDERGGARGRATATTAHVLKAPLHPPSPNPLSPTWQSPRPTFSYDFPLIVCSPSDFILLLFNHTAPLFTLVSFSSLHFWLKRETFLKSLGHEKSTESLCFVSLCLDVLSVTAKEAGVAAEWVPPKLARWGSGWKHNLECVTPLAHFFRGLEV